MSDSITKAGRQLLCLHAFYGDITEAKLTFLRGARAYSDFRNLAMNYVFNLYVTEGDAETRKKTQSDFFDYLRFLQLSYHKTLASHSLAEAEFIYDALTPNVGWRQIQEAHRLLCKADGTNPDDRELEFYVRNADVDWELGDLTEPLLTGLQLSRAAYQQLCKFQLECEKHSITLFHNPNQAVVEFSMYLTHISRGFRCRLESKASDSEDRAREEVKASISHLKRVTLDMRKSILTTVSKHRPNAFDKTLMKAVLARRQEEQRLHVTENAKFHLYEQEVAILLARNVFV